MRGLSFSAYCAFCQHGPLSAPYLERGGVLLAARLSKFNIINISINISTLGALFGKRGRTRTTRASFNIFIIMNIVIIVIFIIFKNWFQF